MRRVFFVKHGMADIILALNEEEVKADAITVHMHKGKTTEKNRNKIVKTPR